MTVSTDTVSVTALEGDDILALNRQRAAILVPLHFHRRRALAGDTSDGEGPSQWVVRGECERAEPRRICAQDALLCRIRLFSSKGKEVERTSACVVPGAFSSADAKTIIIDRTSMASNEGNVPSVESVSVLRWRSASSCFFAIGARVESGLTAHGRTCGATYGEWEQLKADVKGKPSASGCSRQPGSNRPGFSVVLECV